MQMGARLVMDCDDVSPGLREAGKVSIGLYNHEVRVERFLRAAPGRLHHGEPVRYVWNELPIHDVEVYPLRGALIHRADRLA